MKKLSKGLSAVIASAMSLCFFNISSMSTSAICISFEGLKPTGDMVGFVDIDFKNLDIKSAMGFEKIFIDEDSCAGSFLGVNVCANSLYLKTKGDDWKEKAKSIYEEKYKDKLSLDICHSWNFDAVGCDVYDKNGNEDKSEIIAELVKDFNDAGILESADYALYDAGATPIFYYDNCLSLYNYDESVGIEEFEGVVSELASEYNMKIEVAEGTNHFKTIEGCYNVSFDSETKTIDKFRLWDDIVGVYPDIKGGFDIWGLEENIPMSSEPIDLLAAIGDTADDGTVYGDINSDSKIGIGDAIAINKYINGSIVFNESQTKAADLNEDGAVNVDDLNIMLQYLVDIIDEFPVNK